jgi:hypothetical protein
MDRDQRKIKEGESFENSDLTEISPCSPFKNSVPMTQESKPNTGSDQGKEPHFLGFDFSQLYLSLSPKGRDQDFNSCRPLEPSPDNPFTPVNPFESHLSFSRSTSNNAQDPRRLTNQLGFYSPRNYQKTQPKLNDPRTQPDSGPLPDFDKDPLDMCILNFEEAQSRLKLMPIISGQCLHDLLQGHVLPSGIIQSRGRSKGQSRIISFADKLASKRFNKWEDLNPDLSCIADEDEDQEDSDEMESDLPKSDPETYLAKRRSEFLPRPWNHAEVDHSNPCKQEESSWILSSKMFAKRQSLQVPSDTNKKTLANLPSETRIFESPLREDVFNNLALDCCLLIIDCRHSYEYTGGHIRSSINIKSQFVLAHLFKNLKDYLSNKNFLSSLYKLEGKEVTVEVLDQIADKIDLQRTPDPKEKDENLFSSNISEGYSSEKKSSEQYEGMIEKDCIPVIVFHCEFSSERAPKMWSLLRKIDRNILSPNSVDLEYYQSYILEGGYRSYYEQFKTTNTVLGSYVSMEEEGFQSLMAQEDKQLRQDRSLFSKLFPHG